MTLVYDLNYGERSSSILIIDCWPDDILQRLEAWKSTWTKKNTIVFLVFGNGKEDVFSVLRENGYKMTNPNGAWWELIT